ncbi:MAG: hypothetical protein IT256_03295 [Chitinophagaceae bacterium]|nr:hypothetical protein [Chitinophagaceae bacterium]
MKKPISLRRLFIPISIVLAYLVFVVYYLLHSRQALLQDYLSLSSCFFRQADFKQQVFTTSLKQQADFLLLLSIPLLIFFVAYCYVHFDKEKIRSAIEAQLRFFKIHWPIMAALAIICIRLFAHAYTATTVCTDEVFTAYNFAQQPIAHLLTYYPIPNNHLLFGLLNHFSGSLSHNYIASGRLLSGFFYIALILGSYLFLVRLLGYRVLAFLCCLLLAQQFAVWGFGSQARGYAMSYWLQWLSFVSFYYYFFAAQQRPYLLLLMVIANVLGFWVLPTFVYFFVFQSLLAFALMLHRRQFFMPFWWAMAASVAGAFLVYLPVFCYSGVGAVFANKYIASSGMGAGHLVQLFAHYFTDTILPTLFALPQLASYCLVVLFSLPFIIALFVKTHISRRFLVFYVFNWCSILLVVLLMQHLTFIRAIGFQLHLSLLLFLLVVAQLCKNYWQQFKAVKALSIAIVAAWSFAYFAYFVQHQSTLLYDQDTTAFYQQLQPAKQHIPANAQVWLSDESFYFHYLLQGHAQLSSYNCNFAQQDFIIISEDDKPIAQLQLTQYQLLQSLGSFRIYRHR